MAHQDIKGILSVGFVLPSYLWSNYLVTKNLAFEKLLPLHWASWRNMVSIAMRLEVHSSSKFKGPLWHTILAAIPLLIKLLNDGNTEIREMAASSLGNLSKCRESYKEVTMTQLIVMQSRASERNSGCGSTPYQTARRPRLQCSKSGCVFIRRVRTIW